MSLTDTDRLKRELFLRSLFPTMPPAAQVRLIELLEEQSFEPDAWLFRLEERADHFMFLFEGRVLMEHATEAPWEFSGLSVVGVIDAIMERPRTRSCRALEPSKVYSIRAADWFDLLEDNGQVARAAIRNFATQLFRRWQELAPRLPQLPLPRAEPHVTEFAVYDKAMSLRQTNFLRRAGMQAVATLAGVADAIVLEPLEDLFEVGSPDTNLYIVARGAIELVGGSDFKFVHGVGDLIGGAGAFCQALHNFAARSLTHSIVLRIHTQDFFDQAEEHARLTRGTLAYMVSELERLLALDAGSARLDPRA